MDTAVYDPLEIRDPADRERSQLSLLASFIARARQVAPGWAGHLAGIDPATVVSRETLAKLPILRKGALKDLQAHTPPFGGFASTEPGAAARIFMSPGPIFEPQGPGNDWWRSARALNAAGFGRGDVVHNTFSYHFTPGGWILDAGARALGCIVFPAGPGNTAQQLQAIAQLQPSGYIGVPDYLKILLDAAREGEARSPASSARWCRVVRCSHRCARNTVSATSRSARPTRRPSRV